jgi:hypothetical protein
MKILWQTHRSGGVLLHLQGHRLDGAGSFSEELSPTASNARQFPSIVNVPTAGCWRLTLASGTTTGHVTVIAVPGPTSYRSPASWPRPECSAMRGRLNRTRAPAVCAVVTARVGLTSVFCPEGRFDRSSSITTLLTGLRRVLESRYAPPHRVLGRGAPCARRHVLVRTREQSRFRRAVGALVVPDPDRGDRGGSSDRMALRSTPQPDVLRSQRRHRGFELRSRAEPRVLRAVVEKGFET